MTNLAGREGVLFFMESSLRQMTIGEKTNIPNWVNFHCRYGASKNQWKLEKWRGNSEKKCQCPIKSSRYSASLMKWKLTVQKWNQNGWKT